MERTAVSTFETDKRQIYIVGGGIAGLSAAVFAIRDGHIPGNNVHIFETTNVMGGALDGTGSADTYYVCRGARKVNYEVFNCMWDVLSAIPSLTDPHMTVKDEVFEYNRIHKKNAKSRLIDKDRKKSDRPPVVPEGSTNLAFMGQFTESGECVMLVESSVRCGQMGVYSLLNLDKEVPPIYTGAHSPSVWFRTIHQVLK